jgi:glycerol-3-phosphate dehydrogenase subunit C
MAKLTRDKLMTLEAYAKARDKIRAEVMAHKRNRNVSLGDHVTLIFEDEQTIRYQVQEMLRAENIFEEAGIQDELDAYNPLIPDGRNWKATMMIEYEDIEERRRMLARLVSIEDRVWVLVAGFDRVFAIADEDLERSNEQKTSAVHFLRFELTSGMTGALKQGAGLSMGVDHPSYQITLATVPKTVHVSLLKDLND